MNRTQADIIAVAVIGSILVLGSIATWNAYQRWAALGEMGDHMGIQATAMHGTHPVWYLIGTVVVAGVVGLAYALGRSRIGQSEPIERTDRPSAGDRPVTDGSAVATDGDSGGSGATPADPSATRDPIDILPDDEREILRPIIESPGVTQIEVRDRAGYSKSKISQTLSDFERRGLIYRESQGRTYRVYPTEKLDQQ